MWKFLRKYFMPEYSSKIDEFLAHYVELHPEPSLTQRKEQEKYARLYHLRDVDHPEAPSSKRETP